MDEINSIDRLKDGTTEAFYDLDLSAKNITNLSTPNYKAQRRGSFSDEYNNTQRLMHPSKLSVSDNPSDIAIDGQGFFTVQDEDGKILLTRRLNIGQNKEGCLTSNDKLICPLKKLPLNFSRFKVNQKGELYGVSQSDGQPVKVGELLVVNFPGADKLDFDGEYYRPNKEAGLPLKVCLGETSQSKLRQGMIEVSNVNLPIEIARFKQTNERIGLLRGMLQNLSQNQNQRVGELGQLL